MATCTTCGGSGYTAARAILEKLCGDILAIGQEADPECWGRQRPTEDTRRRMLWPPRETVGADGLALTTGLTGKGPLGKLGYDIGARFLAAEKIIAAAGLNPATWGTCPACGGTGETEAPVG